MTRIQVHRDEVNKALGIQLNDIQWAEFKRKMEHGFPYPLLIRAWQDMIIYQKGIFAMQDWNKGLRDLIGEYDNKGD